MDKFEYKVRAEEIRALIAQGDYAQAAEIADSIDWRRVKSVMMLCTISDLYKINRRYEDARDMLLMAYDRHPGGRTIVYSLCELSIKMEEFVQAVEYYKEFVQIAPKDSGRYVLQYKLYEAQDVSLEERIAVLEELKKRDYREKWAYELAYLYHRVGLSTRCVEECDELILWFGDGKYVIKALELKMLHQPLTPQQQQKYEYRFRPRQPQEEQAPQNKVRDTQRKALRPRQNQVEVSAEVAEYNTAEETEEQSDVQKLPMEMQDSGLGQVETESGTEAESEMTSDIEVKTVDVSQFNTINLQKELAEGLKEIFGEMDPVLGQPVIEDPVTRKIMEPMYETDTESLDSIQIEEVEEESLEPELQEAEVFFGETEEIGDLSPELDEATEAETAAPDEMVESDEAPEEAVETVEEMTEETEEWPEADVVYEESAEITEESEEIAEECEEIAEECEEIAEESEEITEESDETVKESEETIEELDESSAQLAEEQTGAKAMQEAQLKELASSLSMETSGQITMVISESAQIEKQITGQMHIEDVLREWERVKEEAAREAEALRAAEAFDGVEELTEIEDPEEDVEEVDEAAGESDQIVEELNEIVEEIEEPVEVPEEIVEEIEETAEEPEEIVAEPEEEISEESQEEAPGEEIQEEASEEAFQKEVAEESEDKPQEMPRPSLPVRDLTKEEKELFGSFIQKRSSKEMLVRALDQISLAAYTGNVIVTGDPGMDTMELAKNIVREVQMTDSNFSGKTAKITGAALNQKDVAVILKQLKNGALIVEKASAINDATAKAMYKVLQQESMGIIVLLEDTRKNMNRFLESHEPLARCFNARMDMEALSNDALVAFAKKYAREMEYSIDELGVLALHTRISEMQVIDHAVTIKDVKEIMDEAIRRANRKTIGHFFDVLLAKRYDDEDMIILREKDFA